MRFAAEALTWLCYIVAATVVLSVVAAVGLSILAAVAIGGAVFLAVSVIMFTAVQFRSAMESRRRRR